MPQPSARPQPTPEIERLLGKFRHHTLSLEESRVLRQWLTWNYLMRRDGIAPLERLLVLHYVQALDGRILDLEQHARDDA